nr:MAG TPA: toxin [Caudoviricetes sp.]
MTFCELLIFTLVTGIVSGVIATYLVRLFDKHKNDRHGK